MPAATANSNRLQTVMAAYRCPSDTGPDINPNKANYGLSSYGGVWGTGDCKNNVGKGNGIFGPDTAIRMADITDGTSNTLAVGEDSFNIGQGAIWPGIRNSDSNPGDVIGAVDGNDLLNGTQNSNGFSSQHPGGVQFVLCDGSVTFISENVDHATTMARLAQRNDGNVVTLP
jgi:prepilin-type processing-associated H-X9-DG protein